MQQNQPESGFTNSEPHQLVSVIGSATAAQLRQLAAIATTMSKVELRVLLELAARAEPPEFTCRASTRELADATGCGRNGVQRAIEKLTQRAHLTRRAGTATRSAAFRVNFLHVVVAPIQSHPPGSKTEPGSKMEPGTGPEMEPRTGPKLEPPTTENNQLNFGPQLAIDIDLSDLDGARAIDRQEEPVKNEKAEATGGIIERMLQARPRHFQEAQIENARRWVHGYAAKFPAPGNEMPHAPDDQIIAQLLSIAPGERLEGLIRELMVERKQAGISYGWFVTVALQRLHGIKPEDLQAKRAELKLIRNAPRDLARLKKL